MNGAVLIFSLCLSNYFPKAQCEEVRVPMTDAGIQTCIIQAQSSIANWFTEHPGRQGWISAWRCVESGGEDDLL